MASIDTTVLLRWLVQDVPEQTAAVDRLFASGRRFVVEDAAIIEVVFVLERIMRLSRATIDDTVRVLASTACLDLDRSLWAEVMEAYVRLPKLSVADAFLAVKASVRGASPLYTFDRKLASQMKTAALVPFDPPASGPSAR